MAGEHHMQKAAEAVHEIIGDRLGFAIVVWVPGKENTDGGVAYVTNPAHPGVVGAIETVAKVFRKMET